MVCECFNRLAVMWIVIKITVTMIDTMTHNILAVIVHQTIVSHWIQRQTQSCVCKYVCVFAMCFSHHMGWMWTLVGDCMCCQ